MAKVTVKLFGVFRSDTKLASISLDAVKLEDVFAPLNDRAEEVFRQNSAADPSLDKPDPIKFRDAILYVNGEKCAKKSAKLSDGDEIWVMSPASGG